MLREALTGGFVPPEVILAEFPAFTLYGDGTVITQGPQIEIYPPPALPSLNSQSVTPDGIQAILAAAQEAGLTDGDHTYDTMFVSDVGTTVLTVTAADSTSTTRVYALGFPTGGAEIPAAEKEARPKIEAFSAKLHDLSSWLPDGSVGPQEQYTPGGLIVYASPYEKAADPTLKQPERPWPLTTPLSEFGELRPESDTRCGVVTVDDFDILSADASGANQLTPWTSDDARYRLVFRPLLPDETACPS